jgi:uncharacterized protein (TIGR02453 family)
VKPRAVPRRPYFTSDLFRFLRELKRHNDRAWFASQKPRYEASVKAPLQEFIADFAPALRTISPHMIADPSPVGGSLFRIHRDTRFSRDKTPYKTWAAAHFRHRAESQNVHGPGFYLHLEPRHAFAGAGLWQPDSSSQARIRRAIVEDPKGWVQAVAGRRFLARWSLDGEKLKRPPRGFDPTHPLVEDLKRKEYLAYAEFTAEQACEPDFLSRYFEACQRAAPFLRYLTSALGLPF